MVLSAWGQARFRDCFLFRSKGKGRSPVSHHRPPGERPTVQVSFSTIAVFQVCCIAIGNWQSKTQSSHTKSQWVEQSESTRQSAPVSSQSAGRDRVLFVQSSTSYHFRKILLVHPAGVSRICVGRIDLDRLARRTMRDTHVIPPTCCALVCLVSKSHAVRCPRRNTVRVSAPLEGEVRPRFSSLQLAGQHKRHIMIQIHLISAVHPRLCGQGLRTASRGGSTDGANKVDHSTMFTRRRHGLGTTKHCSSETRDQSPNLWVAVVTYHRCGARPAGSLYFADKKRGVTGCSTNATAGGASPSPP